MRDEGRIIGMKRMLRFSLAGAFVAIVVGCNGNGEEPNTDPTPPTPMEKYGAAAVTYAEPCTFAFGVIGTRYTSAASAEADVRNRCAQTAEEAAAVGHKPRTCMAKSFEKCAAVVAGSELNPATGYRRCYADAWESGSISTARSLALQRCEDFLGIFDNAHCEVLISACASGTGGSRAWYPPSGGDNGNGTPPPGDGGDGSNGDLWAAIAIGDLSDRCRSRGFAFALDHPSRSSAESAALSRCRDVVSGNTCSSANVVSWSNGCGAFAEGDRCGAGRSYGYGSLSSAEQQALVECGRVTTGCIIKRSSCTSNVE